MNYEEKELAGMHIENDTDIDEEEVANYLDEEDEQDPDIDDEDFDDAGDEDDDYGDFEDEEGDDE